MVKDMNVKWLLVDEEAFKYKAIFEAIYQPRTVTRKDRNDRDFIIKSMVAMASKNIVDIKSPVWVGYKVTNVCNLDCIHCWACNSGYMPSYNDVTLAIDKLSEVDVNFLGLSGGELFLRRDIFDLLRHCKQRKMRLELFTNAILINEEKIGQLNDILDKESDIFQVSLDGVSSHVFKKQRNTDKLDVIISNIKSLRKNGYRVRISYVATHVNVNELYLTYKFAADIGAEGFSVSPVYPKNKGALIHGLLNMHDYYNQVYKCIVDKTNIEFVFFVQIDFFKRIDTYIESINTNTSATYVIDTGLISLYIDANGDVYPEFQLDYPEFKFGNIYSDSVESIMQNSKDKSRFARLRSFVDEQCKVCRYSELCLPHSYEQSYETYKNINKKNPNCLLGSI